jgi:hypothetical protein
MFRSGVRHRPDAFLLLRNGPSFHPLYGAANYLTAPLRLPGKFGNRTEIFSELTYLSRLYLHSRHRSREHPLAGKPETRGNLCKTQFQQNRTVSGACATAPEGWQFHH